MSETLKKGAKGDAVEALQGKLQQLGFDVKPDGIFGPNTAQAVEELQTAFGYDVDGIVGALTPCATRFVCTAPDTPRAVPAIELAEGVRRRAGSTPVTADSTPWHAVEAAWRGSWTVCVTGSIVLVGEVRSALERSR